MILRTTIGSNTANSFVTLAEADAYMAGSSYRDRAQWLDLGEESREEHLIMAGLIMCSLSWDGYPIYKNQAMPFPRVFWRNGEWIYVDLSSGDIEIPEEIKKAQVYIAWDIVHRNFQSVSDPSDGALGDTIARFDLFGDVSVSYGRGSSSTEIPLADGESWGDVINNDHLMIDLLLSKYRTQLRFTTAFSDVEGPGFLDEVAATE